MRKGPLLFSLAGAAGMLAFYLVVLSLANSPEHALEQLRAFWYWVALLSAGFGVQVGLYSHVRGFHTGGREVAASGSASTGSMVACCAHHAADVLPVLGIGAASALLMRYQEPLMVTAVLINIVGVAFMLTVVQRHGLYGDGVFGRLFRYDMRRVRNLAIVLAVLVAPASFLYAGLYVDAPQGERVTGTAGGTVYTDLPPRASSENGVSVEVRPVAEGDGLAFEVSLNTHSGSLDFDVAEAAVLEDGSGESYAPLEWRGDPPGGHHRSGTLVFPAPEDPGELKLTIRDVRGAPERVFAWKLS